jgi:hypothetical protein
MTAPATCEGGAGWRPTVSIALAVSALAVLVGFVLRLEALANDDLFVYFTYARNFVEGRPFAYDIGGVRSEGFTSLLFLLALLPAELLRIDLMFWSVLLGLVGLVVSIGLSARLAVDGAGLRREAAPLFVVALGLLLATDPDIALIVGRALETTWSTVFLLLGIRYVANAGSLERDPARRRQAASRIMIAAFLAFSVRPESLAIMAALGLVMLGVSPERRAVVLRAAVFTGCIGALLGLKYLVFGDPFPTAWYRKVAAGSALPGLEYVGNGLRHYAGMTVLAAIVVAAAFRWGRRGDSAVPRHRAARLTHPAVLLAIAGLASVLLTLGIVPLVGYGHRFLYPFVFFGKALVAAGLTWAVTDTAVSLRPRWGLGRPAAAIPAVLALVLSLGWLGITVLRGEAPSFADGIDLYGKCRRSLEDHKYIRFGRYLNASLDRPKDVTLAFGDAGGIPYTFHGGFIDLNGLAEPAIARLFGERDPVRRTSLYVAYLLERRPDVIILSWGDPRDGPFFDTPLAPVMKALSDAGYRYLCSLLMYSRLEVAVDPGSPQIAELERILLDYALANGGVVESRGVMLTDPTGRQVYFARHEPRFFDPLLYGRLLR